MRIPSTVFYAILLSTMIVPVCTPPASRVQADDAAATAENHPLKPLIQIATEREDEIRDTIRDYTCRIVKKEQIHGIMQDYRYIDARVRLPRGDKPLAVYMKFLGPKDVAGRTVVYKQGQNDDKMLVRRGGERFDYVVTEVETDSDPARRESSMDIQFMGVASMVSGIVKHLKEDMAADPTGGNTKVEIFENAKINGRTCKHVRITHPERGDNLKFHLVNIYADNELRLPVRVDAYDWPSSPDKKPELLGEFTYTDVEVNVGLRDNEFTRDRLRTARRE